MHLNSLGLTNFRSFSEADVPLCPDLTIFVGENNGGKSNAIDAIRLLTTPLSARREIYCETTDIRFGSARRGFELRATFGNLSPAQQGRFLSAAADATLERAVFGLVYDENNGTSPTRPSVWAGQLKGAPEPGCLQMVRHVYLPPLRDAKRALASGTSTRIYALLQHFLGEGDERELADRLRRSASDEVLDRVDEAVDARLSALTAGVRRQAASVGFADDERLIDIARDLRFKLADHGITPEDLRYSGHGYANLLYMATIAVELENVRSADLTLFLVEEPEAHLHPQLQAAVLSFLRDQAVTSTNTDEDHVGPAGELQVVVATHSPNLAAWVEGRKLVVFRSRMESRQVSLQGTPEVEAGPSLEEEMATAASDPAEQESATPALPSPGFVDAPVGRDHAPVPVEGVAPVRPDVTGTPRTVVGQPPRSETRCVPLSDLALDPVAWRKVDRYLDVTKSALLFGGRVLLVEGIAEALLLPVIARTHVLRERPADLRTFRSAVFVPIEGVDFEPYVRLLLTAAFSEARVADRVVVMTDGDRSASNTGQPLPGKLRKDALEEIATNLGAADIFDVITNTYSLETELVRAGNGSLLKSVYLELHPESETNWEEAVAKADTEQAQAIRKLFKATRKGDFAQLLAERISSGGEFTPPDYIRETIEALVQ